MRTVRYSGRLGDVCRGRAVSPKEVGVLSKGVCVSRRIVHPAPTVDRILLTFPELLLWTVTMKT